jgi:hypothetical protein
LIDVVGRDPILRESQKTAQIGAGCEGELHCQQPHQRLGSDPGNTPSLCLQIHGEGGVEIGIKAFTAHPIEGHAGRQTFAVTWIFYIKKLKLSVIHKEMLLGIKGPKASFNTCNAALWRKLKLVEELNGFPEIRCKYLVEP